MQKVVHNLSQLRKAANQAAEIAAVDKSDFDFLLHDERVLQITYKPTSPCTMSISVDDRRIKDSDVAIFVWSMLKLVWWPKCPPK